MIDHLQMQALTYQLAYTLCSVVEDLRISQTVEEVPNLLVSALLPLWTSYV
jgi:acetamidase/formamidase